MIILFDSFNNLKSHVLCLFERKWYYFLVKTIIAIA